MGRKGGGLDVKYRREEEQVEFSFPLLPRIYFPVIRVVSRLRARNERGIDFASWKTRPSSLEIRHHCAPPSLSLLFLPRFSPGGENAKITRGLGFASTTRRNSVVLWRTIISASPELVRPNFRQLWWKQLCCSLAFLRRVGNYARA